MFPEFVGPYKIIKELARGGQGIILQGKHSQLRNIVAIKVLLNFDEFSYNFFKQEAKILARLKHPNLIQVLDFGEYSAGGRQYPYMVMEFVKGRDLTHHLKTLGALSVDWSLKIILTIAKALDYAHQYGVIHRDLKPSNILIEDETNRPILIDFGIVKQLSAPGRLSMGSLEGKRLSTSGEILGTPNYLAPEQVDRHMFGNTGPWTDVYGLAATLFTLLTGELPYQGTPMAIFSKLADSNEPVPDLRTYNPEIPAYLAEAVMHSMQKDPSSRPQNMQEFIYSLRSPVVEPRKRNLSRFFKKKYLISSLVGTGFAGLVAYFIAQGVPRKQAERLAEKTIKTSPTPISTLLPSTSPGLRPKTLTNQEYLRYMDNITTTYQAGDYSGAIELCNKFLEMYPEHFNVFEIIATRGSIYQRIGIIAANQGRKAEAKEALLHAEADYQRTIELMPLHERTSAENLFAASRKEIKRILEKLSKQRYKKLRNSN